MARVDGPALLGAAPASGALSALALAAPRQGIAILVPAPVEVDEGEALSGASGGADTCRSRSDRLKAAMLARIKNKVRESSSLRRLLVLRTAWSPQGLSP